MTEPAFRQRFIKARFGWRIETSRVPEEGMGTEPLPFAFTPSGARRKGARIVRGMTQQPSPSDFTVAYDARGNPMPPPAPPPPSRPPRRPADKERRASDGARQVQ